MTDARFPDRWLTDRRVVRLPDAAFRLFVMALAWSASNRTDGRLDSGDLDLVPCPADEALCRVLVEAELWIREGDGYLIADYSTTQTTAAQMAAIDRKRAVDRERQARYRATSANTDVTRDITRDVGAISKARQGKARTGSTGGAEPTDDDHERDISAQDHHSASSALTSADESPADASDEQPVGVGECRWCHRYGPLDEKRVLCRSGSGCQAAADAS